MNNLVIALLVAYLVCSYLVSYRFASLACRNPKSKGFVFRVRWYDRAASTYVLALPIFLILVYLLGEIL